MPASPALPIEPVDSWGPTMSVVLVFVIGWLVTGPFVFAVWRYFVHRGRAMRAESASKERSGPAVGPALLGGKVETDDGGSAIRIEIDQKGREWATKGGWSHEWKEENRAVHVRPFRLRLADGTAITVDPDERVRLVNALETERFEGLYRRRVAELSHGEVAWVSGTIVEDGGSRGSKITAYRSGPGSLALRGSRFEPLEIAGGALDKQFSYWKDFYRGAVGLLALAMFLVHGLLFGHFYAEFWLGKAETATFDRTSTYTTSSKHGPVTHYVIHARLSRAYLGREVTDDVSSRLYFEANQRGLTKVPFMVVPSFPAIHSIGDYADLGILSSIFAFVVVAVAGGLLVLSRDTAMPWYEQARVRERGGGRLEERAWDAQIPGQRGLFVPRPPRRRG